LLNSARFSRRGVGFAHHGGLTPAALDAAIGVRRTLFASFCKRGQLPTHGELTLAAPVNERSCIAQVAVSPVNIRTAEPLRAGGVSPPWISYRDCTGVRDRTVNRLPRLCGSVLTSGFPEPRRANARRSCERAFVHPECRYFSADRLRAPGAADVSQPWW
jgi:hypothetical protein